MRILYSAPIIALLVLGCTGRDAEQQIVFAPKAFFDGGQSGYVYIAGTLTGAGIGYENNTTVIVCYADRKECLTYSVQQIGRNQVGRLDAPIIYPVIKWDDHEVVATETGDVAACNKVTISIERKSETALWVTEPINQSRAQCKNANTKILKWTIEDSPAWKAMSKAGATEKLH